MHAQLEKHWKHLYCVTDLSLHANSGRPTVDPRACGDLHFFVFRVSSDIKRYNQSDCHYGKL